MRTLDDLSPREREIADAIGKGLRPGNIAERMGISTHTVRNHLKAIYRKLGIRSARDLVLMTLHEQLASVNCEDFFEAVKAEAARQEAQGGLATGDLVSLMMQASHEVTFGHMKSEKHGPNEEPRRAFVSIAAAMLNWHRHISAKMQNEEAAS